MSKRKRAASTQARKKRKATPQEDGELVPLSSECLNFFKLVVERAALCTRVADDAHSNETERFWVR